MKIVRDTEETNTPHTQVDGTGQDANGIGTIKSKEKQLILPLEEESSSGQKEIKAKPRPEEKWSFAIVQSICQHLVPNGMARIYPTRPERKARIPHLSETMIEAACNEAIKMHAHFATKLYNEAGKMIEVSKIEGTKIEAAYDKTRFYQFKKRKSLLIKLTTVSSVISSCKEFQSLILTVVPDNVREVEEPSKN